jgi:hypothetical protein
MASRGLVVKEKVGTLHLFRYQYVESLKCRNVQEHHGPFRAHPLYRGGSYPEKYPRISL